MCSGQGFGLSRRLEASFPVPTGFPPPIVLSHSCSFIRSCSLGPDSDQRLLEERADIYCSGAERRPNRTEQTLSGQTPAVTRSGFTGAETTKTLEEKL